MRLTTFRAFAPLLVSLLAATAEAQTSKYYLTTESQIWTVQGGVATHIANAANSSTEGAIAVYGDVRTIGNYNSGSGSQYTLAGAYTGTMYAFPNGTNFLYDGTTNGTYNFFEDYLNSNVYRANRDWSNPTYLFNLASAGAQTAGTSISYDALTNSLWSGSYCNTGAIANFSLTGALLSSFNTPVSCAAALAYDPGDNTLWFVDGSTLGGLNTFYQYSVNGTQLGSWNHPEIGSQIRGGEFDESIQATAPEPASVILIATGLAGVGLIVRRKRSRS